MGKKILIVTNTIKADCGIGRYSLFVVSFLEKLNIKIDLLTEKDKRAGQKNENAILYSRFSFLNILKNIFLTYKKAKRYFVIHALDCWPYGVYAYFSVVGTPKKLFINGVGTYSVPFGNPLKVFFMKLAYRRAEKVFCISRYAEKRIRKIVPEAKTEVVFLGTTKLPDLKKEEVEKYKRKYDFRKYSPILLTVGAIKDRKGQLDTVRAIQKLQKKYKDVLYVIVGDDGDREYVHQIISYARKNNIEDNILILSNIKTDKELAYLYNICDVFLLNSNNEGVHFEGFGLVLLEAAQMGKPVIGSKNCGIEDAIENGYNGYLTEQRNPDDIYNKILLILGKDYSVFSQNSLEFSKRFEWRTTVASYVKYY